MIVTSVRKLLDSRSTGKAVVVNRGSTADGTQVIQWTPHLGANQQWQLAIAV